VKLNAAVLESCVTGLCGLLLRCGAGWPRLAGEAAGHDDDHGPVKVWAQWWGESRRPLGLCSLTTL